MFYLVSKLRHLFAQSEKRIRVPDISFYHKLKKKKRCVVQLLYYFHHFIF